MLCLPAVVEGHTHKGFSGDHWTYQEMNLGKMCRSEMVKSLRNVPFILILRAAVAFRKVVGYGSQCSTFLHFFHVTLSMEGRLVRCFIPSAVYSKTNTLPARLCYICSAEDVQNALDRVECFPHML